MKKNIFTHNNESPVKTIESVRNGLSSEAIRLAFLDNLTYIQGKFSPIATKHDYYTALAYTVRDRLMDSWTKTAHTYFQKATRTICYLSAEFLLGPQLHNNIECLGIEEEVRQAVDSVGLDLDELIDGEPEPGLGNGGLGRLAACYMDSLATLQIPAIGYGIRYEFGIFNQEIRDGWQVESTDKWLRYGNPWEIPRPEVAFDIKLGGHTEKFFDCQGRYQEHWIPSKVVKSVAYDMPIIGYKAKTANMLRLWKAEASESFDFQAFNVGDYYGAVHEKISSENLTKVLYPNDEPLAGRRLRLEQQYFFVSSSLQDMIRIYRQRELNLEKFHEKYAIQLNDTHPSIAVAELMRLFVDEHQMEWDNAWAVVTKTFCYTNHTLLPEALEKWPVSLFASVLPRHFEIILEINRRFLEQMRASYPGEEELIRSLSLIDESGERSVRMANLACVGSYAINGVSALHTELLKELVLHDFARIWPQKFSNKTNGVTPRRFLLCCNPELANLITLSIGDEWITDLDYLHHLEKFVDKPEFQKAWQDIKLNNKKRLANIIKQRMGIELNPDSMFDVQAKRIHEYKRQHLNILTVVAIYNHLRNNPNIEFTPRTVIFAGKAAPAYYMAKLIIKLINQVASVVNNDPLVADRLKVVFLPNYNVKNAEHIYPAADLSEQISTAGKEASGTGNMKFALNGALTIGTLDGANVEIREEVGAENFFLFGLKADEVMALKNKGYNPGDFIDKSLELRAAIGLITSGHFSPNDKNLFKPLIDSILYRDEYLLCADFESYLACQEKVSTLYRDKTAWTKMSILNTARMGKFSSDRAIREYCQDIWHINPVEVEG
ncbi:MAG: glycogen/starch/alpha-glucan phosphorylase [Gammaproteobacteria bacterium]